MGTEAKKEEFEYLMAKVNRPGVEKLMIFIRKSDFYAAPASPKFHGSYEGGLLVHSLNVYKNLSQKIAHSPVWSGILSGISEESIIIVSVLHDICKT